MPVAVKKSAASKKKPVVRRSQHGGKGWFGDHSGWFGLPNPLHGELAARLLGERRVGTSQKTKNLDDNAPLSVQERGGIDEITLKTNFNQTMGREQAPWLATIKNRKNFLAKYFNKQRLLREQNKRNSTPLLPGENARSNSPAHIPQPTEDDRKAKIRLCHALNRLKEICDAGVDGRPKGFGVDETAFADAVAVICGIMQDFNAPSFTLVPTTVARLRVGSDSDDQADLVAIAEAAKQATAEAARVIDVMKRGGPQGKNAAIIAQEDPFTILANAMFATSSLANAAVAKSARNPDDKVATAAAEAAMAAQATLATGFSAVSGIGSGGDAGWAADWGVLGDAAVATISAAAKASAAVAAAAANPTSAGQGQLQQVTQNAEDALTKAQTVINLNPAAQEQAQNLYRANFYAFASSGFVAGERIEYTDPNTPDAEPKNGVIKTVLPIRHGSLDKYEILLDDGSAVQATGNDLWEASSPQSGGKKRSSAKKAKKPVKKAAPKKKTSTK